MSAIILFDATSINPAPATFGIGLAPVQPDNTCYRHPADAASIDEVAADSILATQIEEFRSRAPQENNAAEYHPADASSIDEERARSIEATIKREEADRREAELERQAAWDLYFDRYAEIEAMAEEAELAAKYDAVCMA